MVPGQTDPIALKLAVAVMECEMVTKNVMTGMLPLPTAAPNPVRANSPLALFLSQAMVPFALKAIWQV
jgi:hypothetical protein